MSGHDETLPRREPSIMAVAQAAGVSAQTVSRVASGKDVVRPETRDRVLAAMAELGYRPNSAARALKSGRFRSIGVILSSLSAYGNMKTLEAIDAEAAAAGYSLTLMTVTSATQARVTGAFARLREQAVDGIIIVLETHQLDAGDVALPVGVPIVVIDSSGEHPHPVVDNDQAQGARLATEHLLALGHETVWHVAGPAESYSAERRRAAWEGALRDAGRVIPPVLRGDWSSSSGYVAGSALAAEADVTAVFAANDQMALGVIRALRESGRSVPEAVSVVGFDDVPEARDYLPPLTTVRQFFDRVGSAAVTAIVGAIESGAATADVRIPTELRVRASTSAPIAKV